MHQWGKISILVMSCIIYSTVQAQPDGEIDAINEEQVAADESAVVVDNDEQDAVDETALEEVVVTATKRETSLMETALSVSAFSQDKLDETGTANALDLDGLVPNLQVGFSPTDSGVQVAIRGMTSNNFTELGDPTVAFHFDGLYSPRPQGGLALMHDVQRVEINRGPQGTLFGRNSTAGSINVISARPDFDGFGGNVAIDYGSFNHRTVKGWANIPVTDSIGLRVSLFVDQGESWLNQVQDRFDLQWDTNRDGDFGDPFDVRADGIPNVDQRRNRPLGKDEFYGAINRYGFRISSRFLLSEAVEWNIIYDHFQDNSPGAVQIKDCEKARGTFFACSGSQWDEPVPVNVPGELDMSIATLRSVLAWDITDSMVLEHRIAFAQQKRSQINDSNVSYPDPRHPAYGLGGTGPNAPLTNPDIVTSLGFAGNVVPIFTDTSLITNHSNYDSLVTELQLKSTWNRPLQYIVGLTYLEENNDIRFDVDFPFCCGETPNGPHPGAQTFLQPDRGVESAAIFAQIDYAFNERLNMTLGYRFTTDRKFDVGGRNFAWTAQGEYFAPSNGGNYSPYSSIGRVSSATFYQDDDLTNDDGPRGSSWLGRIRTQSVNTFERSWNQGTWKVGMDYVVTSNLFLYGYVATGFKSGGFQDRINLCTADNCNVEIFPTYEPEHVTTLEVGLKASPRDNLNIIGNFFINQFDDMQQTLFGTFATPPLGNEGPRVVPPDAIVSSGTQLIPCLDGTINCFTVERTIGNLVTNNVAEARIMGIEIEIDWKPYANGRVTGWASWLNAEITSLPSAGDGVFCFERAYFGLRNCPPEDPERGNNRLFEGGGNTLPWSPEWSFTISYDHSWWMADYRLSPYVSVHWQSEMFFTNANFDQDPFHDGQEAYTTADIALRVINEAQGWGGEVFIRNVTNEVVRENSAPGPGYMRSTFYSPRTFGLKFNYTFE